MISLKKLAFAAGAFAMSMASAFAADLTLYTYHSEPPFVTADGKGLTYELADYLTKKSKGALTVKVSVLPRARVDQAVAAADFKDAVPWVFPAWFKDKDKTTYRWSDALFSDENAVVSSLAKKVEYASPESLKGMTFGGVLGHNYVGIDDLVKAGQIERQDSQSEEVNLKKIVAGRIDVTFLPGSSLNFLVPQLGIEGKLHLSGTPQSSYTRHILIAKSNPELLKQVNAAIAEMKTDAGWQDVLKKYHVKAN
ncbi:MAG TPA: transporter substrate-binding domain-containing protein [Aromatoleum sp.]|uniref:substrate-binding periplasmic protein n=1 Tax=Aromatoleum sp. TaxID=2307007 RepID=UPI002B49AC7E|nr:transporter substrate-binding domain-containing protein [Aromatoleum sp.]HJV28030.1 transporter substrate-binding domain-containing protein [Aromatoleum sp.]